ncbi:MAG: cytochrome c biogenesis protein CcsA [Dehalococcoidales bacterium]|nr:MAG: cytochrome c biogenesis protein CcsA [Dehalococcoidales bacterium]
MNRNGVMRNNILLGLSLALMIAALYMVFIYVPTEKNMGVVQRIFYFHVPIAWVAFLAFFIVFINSIMYLWKRDMKWDRYAHASAEVGVIFTTLVLITGSIWAKPVWGIWWTWDARLTASLVLWLIYVAYLLLRNYASEQAQGARIAAVLGIIGFIDVPIVALAINIWRTQHPPALIFEGGLDTPGLFTLLVSIVAFTLLYVTLVSYGITVKKQDEEISRLKDIKSERGG